MADLAKLKASLAALGTTLANSSDPAVQTHLATVDTEIANLTTAEGTDAANINGLTDALQGFVDAGSAGSATTPAASGSDASVTGSTGTPASVTNS